MAIFSSAALSPPAAAARAIQAGSTWQLMLGQNINRSALLIENYASVTSQGIGTIESLFVLFGQMLPPTAPPEPITPTGNPWALGAVELTPGGSINLVSGYCPGQPIWAWAVTQGHLFSAYETP